MIDEAAALRRREARDDIAKPRGRFLGRLHVEAGFRERLREPRRHRAGMQRDAGGLRMRALEFDRRRVDDLIERGLGGAIAVPAAQMIVADAADARRQRGEDRLALAREARREMFERPAPGRSY